MGRIFALILDRRLNKVDVVDPARWVFAPDRVYALEMDVIPTAF